MRTTVEISNELRARLLALAARKGLRGYSEIINEALEEYLGRVEREDNNYEEIMALAGSLSEEESREAEKRIKEFWARWR